MNEAPASAPPTGLELDDLLPAYRFHERHHRRVDLPVGPVWQAALTVTSGQVRALGPLLALRALPSRLLRRPSGDEAGGGDRRRWSLLDDYAGEGFLPARLDDAPVDGRGLVLFCVIGRFWSPTGNAAIPLGGVDEFLRWDQPGVVKAAVSLEAVDRGDHTELITETRVAGTDPGSNRAFAPYWALIRLPSGLIRRSWLAAIARHAGTLATP